MSPRDKFQDSAIPGCRGRLYFKGRLCLIVVDGKPAHWSKCKALERPWMEDITKNTEGKRFEDVEITGQPRRVFCDLGADIRDVGIFTGLAELGLDGVVKPLPRLPPFVFMLTEKGHLA